MTLMEWCKFIRAIKEAAGYTNIEVSEGAGVSLSTVESIMSLNRDKDIMRDTARLIENFVLGVGTGYPCYLAFEENVPDVSQRVSNAMHELERDLDEKHHEALDKLRETHSAEILAIKAKHRAEIDAVKAEEATRVQYLLNHLERIEQEHDNLWNEINRKNRIIDQLMEERIRE